MPKFSKKHYEAIAKVLWNSKPEGVKCRHNTSRQMAWRGIVEEFVDMLVQDNPKFKVERFLDACSYGKDI